MRFFKGGISDFDDAKLLELYIANGKMEYLGELYSRYTPLIYGLCLKYLRNVEAAEDAVMQIFEEVSGKIARMYVREFRTWIYSVAKNHCLQQLRRKNAEIATDFSNSFVESDDMTHLLSKQESEKQLTELEKCIEELPEPQKKSITLFFIEEKSYAEIVEATSYHLKSVKSYIQNGKRNLKICLERQENAS